MRPAPLPTAARVGHPTPAAHPEASPISTRWLTTAATVAALLAGCATPLPPAPPPPPPPPPPAPVVVAPPPAPAPEPEGSLLSYAKTPRDYRRDAAAHLYEKNSHRIFKGRMPPLLYAVGTLEVELDYRGRVLRTSWMRAPNHAPEVMADIERSVRAAAPYPAAVHLGQVVYTDTWLWHKSGFFQLDTLTEGQDAAVAEPSNATLRARAAQGQVPAAKSTKVASEDCRPKTKSAKC